MAATAAAVVWESVCRLVEAGVEPEHQPIGDVVPSDCAARQWTEEADTQPYNHTIAF